MAISRSDMERQLRKDGGILTLEDAKRMAPPGESLAYINPDEAALLKSLGGAGEDINGTGIKSYFLKKVFRKAKKAVKKVVKSPIGKAAILGALTFGIPGTQFGGFAGKGALGKFFGKGSFNPFLRKVAGDTAFSGLGGLLSKAGMVGSGGGLTGLGKLATIGGISSLGGLMAAGAQDEEDEIDFSKLDRGEGLNILDIVARARKNDPEFRFLPGAEFTGSYAEGGRIGKEEGGPINLGMDLYLITKEALEKDGYSPGEAHEKALDASGMRDYFDKISEKKKYGGRIGKQEGGEVNKKMAMIKDMLIRGADDDLIKTMTGATQEEVDSVKNTQRQDKAEGGIMNLGGNEMDLRGGGFVPIGAKEKADDVPARLSKNEFVMTADAVRAAGGGSVDKGADRMYNMMKNLEAQV